MAEFNYEKVNEFQWREYVSKTAYKTLGELIETEFAGFEVPGDMAPLDMDVSHGYEIEIVDNTRWGHGIFVTIHPFILWTDGLYKPCHYWGIDKFIHLSKR